MRSALALLTILVGLPLRAQVRPEEETIPFDGARPLPVGAVADRLADLEGRVHLRSEILEADPAARLHFFGSVELLRPEARAFLHELLLAKGYRITVPGPFRESAAVVAPANPGWWLAGIEGRLLRPEAIRAGEAGAAEFVATILPLGHLDLREVMGLVEEMQPMAEAFSCALPAANAVYLAGGARSLATLIAAVERLELLAAARSGASEVAGAEKPEPLPAAPAAPWAAAGLRPWPLDMRIALAACLERAGVLDSRRYALVDSDRELLGRESELDRNAMPGLGPALHPLLHERLFANGLVVVPRRDAAGPWYQILRRRFRVADGPLETSETKALAMAEGALMVSVIFDRRGLPLEEVVALGNAAFSDGMRVVVEWDGRLRVEATVAGLRRFRILVDEFARLAATERARRPRAKGEDSGR